MWFGVLQLFFFFVEYLQGLFVPDTHPWEYPTPPPPLQLLQLQRKMYGESLLILPSRGHRYTSIGSGCSHNFSKSLNTCCLHPQPEHIILKEKKKMRINLIGKKHSSPELQLLQFEEGVLCVSRGGRGVLSYKLNSKIGLGLAFSWPCFSLFLYFL